MKTKSWICLIGVLLVVCLGLSIWILRPQAAATYAQITSDGKHIQTVDLTQNGSFSIESPNGGYNILTVTDGKIAVTEASCPDHYCMKRGFLNSGTDIVCLPNRLVIHFISEKPDIDAAVG